MAIDNQMLIGAGCLGVIVLVVAMHGKEGDPDVEMEETHEDAPSNEEVDLRLDNVYSLRNRFDDANKGALTTEQLNAFDKELNVLDKLTQSIPPGDYGRKIKTQKNRRGAIKVEEYAV